MKTSLFILLLHIFLGLRVVSFGDEHEHVGIEPVGETDGVVLLTLLGDELSLTLFGSAVDHTNVEIVNFAPFDEPHANIGGLVRPDDAHLAIDAARFRDRKVGPVCRLNGNSLVCDMVDGIVLGETIYRRQYNDQYENQPFHAAKIIKHTEIAKKWAG